MTFARKQLETAARYARSLTGLPASDDGEDRVRAFFENCWHVKDHAKADLPASDHARFEKDVAASRPLQIVADVANRSKHVTLTQHDRLGAAMSIKELQAFEGSSRAAVANFKIQLADGTVFGVEDAASAGLAAWEPILSKYGL